MKLRLLPVMLVLAAWLAAPAPAWACACLHQDVPPPRRAFAIADAVFLGTVTGIADYRHIAAVNWLVRIWPGAVARFVDIRVRFNVDESWKEVTTTTVTVRTGSQCGSAFSPGAQYFVYADQANDVLWVAYCSRTVLVNTATEDVAYLDPLPRLRLEPAWPAPVALGCLGLVVLLALPATAALWRARRSAAAGRGRQ